MIKRVFAFLLLFFILPTVLAVDLSVQKVSENGVMVLDIGKPAQFDFKITNEGSKGSFKFSNLLGFPTEPEDWVFINAGETKDVSFLIYPRENFVYTGYYKLDYDIFVSNGDPFKDELLFKITRVENTFKIGAEKFHPETNSFTVYIENKENFNFGDVKVQFTSQFFDLEKDINIGPNERMEFEVNLNKEEFKKLMAGYYTLDANVIIDGKESKVQGIINFEEKDSLLSEEESYGFFINTKIIKKTNDGNILQDAKVTLTKNVLSRLFTSFSPEPDFVRRDGMTVYYTWEDTLKPGEVLDIKVKTNWFFPILILVFAVAIVILVNEYSKTDVILRKEVSFVNAKGGEFALKVVLFVKAKNYVQDVSVVDRLPSLVRIYERFGSEHPKKVDEKNKRIEWGFDKLEAGEVRTLSYIIYSKVGVLGKFALPPATAFYKKEGELKESESNRAFFVAEPGEGRDFN